MGRDLLHMLGGVFGLLVFLSPAYAWAADMPEVKDVRDVVDVGDPPASTSQHANRSPAVDGGATGITSFDEGLFNVDALMAASLVNQASGGEGGEEDDSAPAIARQAR